LNPPDSVDFLTLFWHTARIGSAGENAANAAFFAGKWQANRNFGTGKISSKCSQAAIKNAGL
jgi:hypothetical protein